MTIYQWPTAKVWLIIADSRFEREQILDEHFNGQVVCVKELIASFLDAATCGEQLAQWHEQYTSPPLLAFTEAHWVGGKEATTEELCEILWERYRQNKATVLTADFLPNFLEKTFGLPHPI